MKTLKSLFKNIYNFKTIFYLLLGSTPFLYKNIEKWKLSLLLLGIIILINIINIITKKRFYRKIDGKQIYWILCPILVYSVLVPPKVIGFLMIANLISDRIASVVRSSFKPFYTKFFSSNMLSKNINGTFVFILINFIISILYIYYMDGFIIKKYIFIIFINSIVLGLTENSFKIKNLPDNFNINIFGSLFVFLSLLIDFKLRISSINVVFGLLICLLFTVVLVLFDIIKLKSLYKYYFISLVIYSSLGYHLFLFNIIILTGIGLIKKIYLYYNRTSIHYLNTFVEIDEIKDYFLLPLILACIYFIIPHLKIIRISLIVCLITALLHYFNEHLNQFITKKYIKLKNIKISQQVVLYNLLITFILLFSVYLFELIRLIPMIYSYIFINVFLLVFMFIKESYYNIFNTKYSKFLVIFFSFKIHFLLQLL